MFNKFCLVLFSVYWPANVAIAADNTNCPWLINYSQQIQQQRVPNNIPGYVFAYIEKGQPAKVTCVPAKK